MSWTKLGNDESNLECVSAFFQALGLYCVMCTYKTFRSSIPGTLRCPMMGVSAQGKGVDYMPLRRFNATDSDIEEEENVLAI